MNIKFLLPLLSSVVFIVLRTVQGIISDGLFTHLSNLTGHYCAGDGLLFSQTGPSLFYCINVCFRSKRQACVGIFYQEIQHQCFACGRMENTYLLPMAGTVAWKIASCSKYLVQDVVDNQLSESSHYSNHLHEAIYARLDTVETIGGKGGWTSAKGDPDPYIQVDFLELMRVTGVVIQSRSHIFFHQWVTEYRVLASRDCSCWEYVTDREGAIEYFPGNTEVETKVTNLFDLALVARCIRVNPTKHHGYTSMRFDVIGCDLRCDGNTVPNGIMFLFFF